MTTHEKTNVAFSFLYVRVRCAWKKQIKSYIKPHRAADMTDCMTGLFFDTFCMLMMSESIIASRGHHKPVCNDYGECSIGGVGGTLFDVSVSDWIDCSNCSRATESISLIRFS